MRATHRLIVMLLSTTIVACSSVQVATDYDPDANLSSYETYSWLPRPVEPTGDVRADNPLVHARVRDAVDEALKAKGYERLLEGRPDFYIGYHLSLTTKLDASRMNNYYGYGARHRPGMGTSQTVIREYEVGVLVLDIVDADLDRLVWRSTGRKVVQETPPTPEESRQRILDAVTQILEPFPPQ